MKINVQNAAIFNIVLPLILGISFLYYYKRKLVKAEEIGIGRETTIYTPWVDNYPLHITYLKHVDTLYNGWEKQGSKTLTLWLGNSQLHSINQYKGGQQNCIHYLYDSLQHMNKTVLGISYPNANLQEFLFTVLYFTQKCTGVKQIVLPVFFDDMREDKIRDDIGNSTAVEQVLQSKDSGYFSDISSISHLKNKKSAGLEMNKDMQALDATAQEKSELFLDSITRTYWSVWRERPNTRAALFNDLHKFRNYVLGIKANTKRKMIAGVYKENYHALLDILKFCNDKKIKLLVYIPPLRNDTSPPYEIDAYNHFKKEVEKDALANNAVFVNLENLVAANYWGHKGSTTGSGTEIDFMHFQEPGHKLLADTVFKLIKNDF